MSEPAPAYGGDGRVYGRHPVLELLRSGGRRADEVAVLAGGHGPLAEVVALARKAGVKVSFRTREQFGTWVREDEDSRPKGHQDGP